MLRSLFSIIDDYFSYLYTSRVWHITRTKLHNLMPVLQSFGYQKLLPTGIKSEPFACKNSQEVTFVTGPYYLRSFEKFLSKLLPRLIVLHSSMSERRMLGRGVRPMMVRPCFRSPSAACSCPKLIRTIFVIHQEAFTNRRRQLPHLLWNDVWSGRWCPEFLWNVWKCVTRWVLEAMYENTALRNSCCWRPPFFPFRASQQRPQRKSRDLRVVSCRNCSNRRTPSPNWWLHEWGIFESWCHSWLQSYEGHEHLWVGPFLPLSMIQRSYQDHRPARKWGYGYRQFGYEDWSCHV